MDGVSLTHCPACRRDVSSRAPACPQCGHPLRAQVASASTSPINGWVWKGAWLVLLGGVALVAWTYWLPSRVKDRIVTALKGGAQVVIDERFGVAPREVTTRCVVVSEECEVVVKVDVTLGDGVNMFVGDAEDVAAYQRARRSGGAFWARRAEFTGERVQSVTKRGRLSAGEWYVVVENPTFGLMTRVSTFDVHLQVELRR